MRDTDETKKDRTKDLHPSIKSMIENASATKRDKAGELGENFLSLYNSKTHGGLDIQLHQLFEDADMGDVGFAEGVSTNIRAGIFTRIQKSAPGPFSPFSFSEETTLSTNSKKDRSLLLKIYSLTKGGLIKSVDDVMLTLMGLIWRTQRMGLKGEHQVKLSRNSFWQVVKPQKFNFFFEKQYEPI